MKWYDLFRPFSCARYAMNIISDPHNNSTGTQFASDPALHQVLSYALVSQKAGISSKSPWSNKIIQS